MTRSELLTLARVNRVCSLIRTAIRDWRGLLGIAVAIVGTCAVAGLL